MLKRTNLNLPLVVLLALLFPAFSLTARALPLQSTAEGFRLAMLRNVAASTDKEQDGLAGPVRRIRTETAKIMLKEGKALEGPRQVLETATYDIKGNKIDNAYFLAAGGSLTGKENYKYDDKGNITEMTLQNADGSLLSKEVYTYDFDSMGNWTKMTTAVAVLEGGKITYEPTEVTYRSIAYYLEETTAAKMSQPAPAAPAANAATSSATSLINAAASSSAAKVPAQSAPANVSAAKPNAAPFKSGATAVAPSSSPSNVAAKSSAPAQVTAEMIGSDKTKVYAAANPNSANASAGGSSAPVVLKDESEAPATPVVKAPVKPISGGVLNGKAVKLAPPVYPAMARQARISGLVSVEVVIDATGKVISVKAVSGPTMLHQAAEDAARQARFSPTLLSGQPVKISGVINYNFTF